MIARCNRRAAARGLLAVLLLLCVLRGGLRLENGPETFVDLRLRRAAPTAAAAAPVGTPAAAITATIPAVEALPELPMLVGEKLSLMLPLGPAVGSSVHGDHGRLSLLLRSLAKFFVLADLDALVIVTPDATGVQKLIASIAKLASSTKLDALLAKAVVIADVCTQAPPSPSSFISGGPYHSPQRHFHACRDFLLKRPSSNTGFVNNPGHFNRNSQ